MSVDAYLIIILASLTVLLISMQPVVWIAWGVGFMAVCIRLVSLLFQFLQD